MQTTITLDSTLIAKARVCTGLKSESRIIHEALKALIARENARWLELVRPSAKEMDAIAKRCLAYVEACDKGYAAMNARNKAPTRQRRQPTKQPRPQKK